MLKDYPVTRVSLVLRLRDGSDSQAWSEFVALYGPIVYRFARKRGLQDADAADLLQDVLRSVSGAIGKLDYDREKGGFRAWVFTITRNKVFSFLRLGQQDVATTGGSEAVQIFGQTPDRMPSLEDDWEIEFRRQLVARALDGIEGEFEVRSWQAFRLTAVEGLGAADVSQRIGLSTGAIYVAKSRVLARLKTEVERLLAEDDG